MPALKVKTKVAAVTGTTTEVDDKGDKDLLAQIDQWHENVEMNWFNISRAFPRVYDEELYKQIINPATKKPFETFKDYIEQHLGLDYRISLWRLQNGRAILQFGISPEKVAHIGWSKFKELTSSFNKDTTPKDVDAILKRAEGKTFKQIQDMVQKERTERAGGVHHRKVTMKFTFMDEQAKVIENALTEAKSLSNTENLSLALEYICMEWLMNHNPDIAQQIANKLHAEEVVTKVPHKEHANVGKKSSAKKLTKNKGKK